MDGIYQHFLRSHPKNPLQGWIFHVQSTPSSDFDYLSCFRCIRYVDFHLFEWKKQSTNPPKKSNFCTPKSAKVLCNCLFVPFFCSPQKKQREKMVEKKTTVSAAGTGESYECSSVEKARRFHRHRKTCLWEKMSDGKGELWVLEM